MAMPSTLEPEKAVRDRYAAAARAKEAGLCCPVMYDRRLLDPIPAEILERDYGCGDPTPYVHAGDTVIDLGCGGGKICYIAAQMAGPKGKVIGDDGHLLRRGERAALCDKTYRFLTRAPYAESVVPVPPLRDVSLEKAQPFACRSAALRDPRETKRARYRKTTAPQPCGGEGCC